ncbi:hypothetical protein F5888DRAFT_1624187, partial [Russula emetica]
NHHVLPRPLWKEIQEAKNNPKATQQRRLDGAFETVKGPLEFTREGVLHVVARFVACDDKALAVANKAVFCNCLIAMRPKAKTLNLPSMHNVTKYIHNKCIKWLTELKVKIHVSGAL